MSHGYSHRVARDHIIDLEIMKLQRRAAPARPTVAPARTTQRDTVIASLLRRPDADGHRRPPRAA